MRDPKEDQLADAVHQRSHDSGQTHKSLDDVFQDGVRARDVGTPSCDNPYAAGSEERQEWSAGWCAAVKPDGEDDEPNSGYVKN